MYAALGDMSDFFIRKRQVYVYVKGEYQSTFQKIKRYLRREMSLYMYACTLDHLFVKWKNKCDLLSNVP